MKLKTLYILPVFLFAFLFAGCENNDAPSEVTNEKPIESTKMTIRVNTLGATVANPGGAEERIRSLRIIIIDNEGLIEANEKSEFSSTAKASDFSHTFSKQVNSNPKSLYLLANEECVGAFSLSVSQDLPTGLPMNSLSALLDYFSTVTEETSHSGSTLEKILNSIYFENSFDSYRDNGVIYLPYSAHYNLQSSDLGLEGLTHHLLLVPVASKIDFSFVSYRSHDTRIDDIKFNTINPHNYLNARLAADETRKPFEGGEIWWIDWLQECAKSSQSAEDIEEFNEKWGWIEHYTLPLSNDAISKSLKPSEETWQIDRMADKNNPDKKSFGPFYLPESKSPVYTLDFSVTDLATNETTSLEGYEIDTLNSLFRATHVKIFVELYEKAMDIYAEVVPWNEKVFIGYVQEDDE